MPGYGFLKVIKSIIFDFDGVIMESTDIKTEAFRQLFKKWPDHVDDIVYYHMSNMGVSRYEKFKYIYKNILKDDYSDEVGLKLGDVFSQIVLSKLLKAPFVYGAGEFLHENHESYSFYIVSATPEKELIHIVRKRMLLQYFKGVYGSPQTKDKIVHSILVHTGLSNKEIVMVGDAEVDYSAANKHAIPFIARITKDNSSLWGCKNKIKDFSEMDLCLANIHNLAETI